MSDKGTLQLVAENLILALKPLRDAVQDLDSFRAFMMEIGWDVQSIPPSWVALANDINDAVGLVEGLADSPSLDEIEKLYTKIQALYNDIQNLSEAPAGVDAGAFLADITERLLEVLLVDYLAAAWPATYNVFQALGVITLTSNAATATQPAYVKTRFLFPEIPRIITDPLSIPQRVYGWGTADLNFSLVAEHLLELFGALDVRVATIRPDRGLAKGLQTNASQTDKSLDTGLYLPLAETVIAGTPYDVGLSLLEFPGEAGKMPGLILQPVLPSSAALQINVAPDLNLNIRAGTDLSKTFGIFARPGEIGVRYPFEPGTTPPTAGFGIELAYQPAQPKVLLGAPDESRLQVVGVSTGLGLDFRGTDLEFHLGFDLNQLAAVIALGDQDSFISKLLGGELNLPIPLGLRWSSKDGFTFSGSLGFSVSTAPHLELGPISIDTFQLAVLAALSSSDPASLKLTAGVGFSGELGPVSFSVEDIGVQLNLVFQSGNAGPFKIEVGFKPPKGVGLEVDASAVVGGGYLFFDWDKEQYAGVLMLSIEDTLTLKAVGLLTTKMPDGSKGFSLLIIISVEFSPIQLGFGFTLNGVGGLAGINRTFLTEPLRTGIRDHTVDHILFPEDPVNHAQQIISDLQAIFPPYEGRYVFGPMIKIGWGTPTLVTAELGVILQVPDPIIIAILGKVDVLLPEPDAPIIELHLGVVGILDFGQKLFSLDASLYDSRIVAFSVFGDMALRLGWGENSYFALAIGGFNPHFQQIPPNFPSLRRFTLSLSSGDNPRFSIQGYLAITSNSFQTGALAELYAELGPVSIYGYLGFDALFIFSPFSFIVDFTAGISLRVDGTEFAAIHLDATLSGTTPWHVHGTASVSLWIFSVSVTVDERWGDDQSVTLPPKDPWVDLQPALQDPRNWSGLPAEGAYQAVSLALPQPDSSGPPPPPVTYVDPVGTLQLKEKVLPLNQPLTKYAEAKPAGPGIYRIDEVTLGSGVNSQTIENPSPALDAFAPAQFEDLADDEKLSRPSFEQMQAGVKIADQAVDHGQGVDKDIEYDTEILDTQWVSRLTARYKLPLSTHLAMTERSAAAKAALRNMGMKKYASKAKDPLVALGDEDFVIASSEDLSARSDLFSSGTKTQALQALKQHLQSHPEDEGTLEVMPSHEAVAA